MIVAMEHHQGYTKDTGSSRRSIEAVRALARAASVLERTRAEVTLPQYRVLAAISSGDDRASHVARRLALGKPSVSVAVEGLCARGLIVRSRVDDDLRAVELRLTDDGRRLLDHVEDVMATRIEELAARTDQPSQVFDALIALGSAIDEVAAERHLREAADHA
jgi:DNA-binding MarR family transcriptional regulator